MGKKGGSSTIVSTKKKYAPWKNVATFEDFDNIQNMIINDTYYIQIVIAKFCKSNLEKDLLELCEKFKIPKITIIEL